MLMFKNIIALFIYIILLNSLSYAGKISPQALDSKFSVTANGQAEYTIPLDVPPGINGMQPKLEIAYRNTTKNGWMGPGWSIQGISKITRVAPNKFYDGKSNTVQFNYQDRFTLDGQRLISVKNAQGKIDTSSSIYGKSFTEYHTANEQWIKVVSQGTFGNGPASFMVTTKDGKTMLFGGSDDSQIVLKGSNTIYQWLLTRVVDLHGNSIEYKYYKLTNNGGTWYPNQITYTKNTSQGLKANRMIHFTWTGRTDSLTHYVGGASWTQTLRLSSIDMRVNNAVKYQYNISYQDSLSPLTKKSIVKRIQKCDDQGNCISPTDYTWQQTANISYTPIHFQTNKSDGGEWFNMDMNGDGKTDIMRIKKDDGKVYFNVYRSRGDGQYDSLPSYPAGTSNNEEWVHGDFNADGMHDVALIYTTSKKKKCFQIYLSKGNGSYNKQSVSCTDGKYSGDTYTGDFNGDGRTDIMLGYNSNKNFKVYVGKGDGNFTSTDNLTFSKPKGDWYTADMNGDGITDLLNIYKDGKYKFQVNFFRNNGKADGIGAFSTNTSTSSGWLLGDINGDGYSDIVNRWSSNNKKVFQTYLSKGNGNFDSTAICKCGRTKSGNWTTMDVNGDGKTDIINISSDDMKIYFYLSIWNGQFKYKGSYKILYTDLPYRIGDFNGDGVSDFTYIYFNDKAGKKGAMRFKSFRNGISKQDYLKQIDDRLNYTTNITYTPISNSSVYTRNTNKPAYPLKEGQSTNYVVSSYNNNYGSKAYVQKFKYSGAISSLNGLGWAGFKSRLHIDVPDSTSTKHYYNQTYPFIGKIDSIINLQTDNQFVLGKTRFNYWPASSPNMQSYHNVYQTLVKDERKETWYNNKFIYRIRKSFEYDRYANVKIITNMLDTTGRDSKYPTTYTISQYQNDTTNWRLGYLTYQKESKARNSVTSFDPRYDYKLMAVQYDNKMNSYLRRGYDDTHNKWIDTHYDFDNYGNVTSVRDPANNITITTYDETFQTYPVSTSTPYNNRGDSLITYYTYEPGYGNLIKTIDPNGRITQYCIDNLGHTHEVQTSAPSGGVTDNSCILGSNNVVTIQKYSLDLINPGVRITTKERVDWNSNDSSSWFVTQLFNDPAGKEYKTIKTGAEGQKIYSQTLYNSAERMEKRSLPYYEGSPIIWDEFQYDILGNITQIQSVDIITRYTYQPQNSSRINKTVAFGTPDSATSSVNLTRDGRVFIKRDANNSPNGISGPQTTFSYDPLGRVRSIQDPDGITTLTTYNSLGFKTFVQNKVTGNTSFQYNNKGQLIKEINARKDTISYRYDDLSRMTHKKYSRDNDSITIEYKYDELRQGFFNKGRNTTVSKYKGRQLVSQYEMNYDLLGNMVESRIKIQGISEFYTHKFKYDAQGNLISKTFPDNSVLENVLHTNGLMDSIKISNAIQGRTSPSELVSTYDNYQAMGQPGKIKYGNNVKTKNNYNNIRNFVSDHVIYNALEDTLINSAYFFNKRFFITNINDLRSANHRHYDHSQAFFYTPSGRLDSAYSAGLYGTKKYKYSSGGNLKEKDGITYGYNKGQHLTSGKRGNTSYFTAHYDSIGNMIEKVTDHDTWHYSYDLQNNLIQIEKSGAVVYEFVYDHNGERIISKDFQKNKTTYYYGGEYIVESNISGYDKYHTKIVNGPAGRITTVTNPDNKVTIQTASIPFTPLLQQLSTFYDFINPGNSSYFFLVLFAIISMIMGFYYLIPLIRKWRTESFLFFNPDNARPVAPLMIWASLFYIFFFGANTAYAQPTLPNGETNQTLYYHNNHIQSLSIITDSGGNLVLRNAFTPYGEIITSKSTNPGAYQNSFGDGQYDQSSSLYYLNARYYDPQLGRFLSPDNQVGNKVFGIDAFNRYAYSGNNPVDYNDPSGHFISFLVAILVGAIVGAIVNMVADIIVQGIQKGFDNIDPDQVFMSTIIGALGGAAGGAVGFLASKVMSYAGLALIQALGGVSKGVMYGIGIIGGFISGAAAGVTSQFTANVFTRQMTGADIPLTKNLGWAALFGGVAGAIGGSIGVTRLEVGKFQIRPNADGRYMAFPKGNAAGAGTGGPRPRIDVRLGAETFGQKYSGRIGLGLSAITEIKTVTAYNAFYAEVENQQEAIGISFSNSGSIQPTVDFYNAPFFFNLYFGNLPSQDALNNPNSINDIIEEWSVEK